MPCTVAGGARGSKRRWAILCSSSRECVCACRRMHGQGSYTDADGVNWSGQFYNGKFFNGKAYLALRAS